MHKKKSNDWCSTKFYTVPLKIQPIRIQEAVAYLTELNSTFPLCTTILFPCTLVMEYHLCIIKHDV